MLAGPASFIEKVGPLLRAPDCLLTRKMKALKQSFKNLQAYIFQLKI
jgi:hypothetical protein